MSEQALLPGHPLKDVRIFIVDDEDILAWSLETELKSLGAEVLRAGSLRQALERFPDFQPDLAITDLRLPDGNGLELVQKWRKTHPAMPTILITAHGAIDSAITALRLGAFDYLQKPFDMKDLIASVNRAAELSQLRQKVSRLQGVESSDMQVQIVGSSPAVETMRERLRQIAKSKANTVIIFGESGTGKELAARALHAWSERASRPFVEINCASIPENLLESELFGYEKGAFTDARERKLGLFEIAKNGTIFLDEIGELPLQLQAKLLRALEYRRFKRLGGTRDIEFSARIVAATNRDLLEEVLKRNFRGDLFYRLNVLPIHLPRLNQRKSDIPELVEFLLGKMASELGIRKPSVSPEALTKLASFDWPGNIRELANVLQRALVFHEPVILRPEHLDLDELQRIERAIIQQHDGDIGVPGHHPPVPSIQVGNGRELTNLGEGFHLPESGINLETLERSLLEQALDRARNNQTRAAQLLGITRHTLRYRLEKHGLLAPNSN